MGNRIRVAAQLLAYVEKRLHAQVLVGGSPGEIILIVDCPSTAHVEELMKHPRLRGFTAPSAEARETGEAVTPGNDEQSDECRGGASQRMPMSTMAHQRSPYLIVHLSPPNVCESELYQSWCDGVAETTHHVFLNFTPQPQRFAFVASARLQLKLHGIHDEESAHYSTRMALLLTGAIAHTCPCSGLPKAITNGYTERLQPSNRPPSPKLSCCRYALSLGSKADE